MKRDDDIDVLLDRISALEKVIEPWAYRSCLRIQMNPDQEKCLTSLDRRDWCQFCIARDALFPQREAIDG